MNAPDKFLHLAAARANHVLRERLTELATLHSWQERRIRIHVAHSYSMGSPEKWDAILRSGLLDVAVSGIDAVWPQGRPE